MIETAVESTHQECEEVTTVSTISMGYSYQSGNAGQNVHSESVQATPVLTRQVQPSAAQELLLNRLKTAVMIELTTDVHQGMLIEFTTGVHQGMLVRTCTHDLYRRLQHRPNRFNHQPCGSCPSLPLNKIKTAVMIVVIDQ